MQKLLIAVSCVVMLTACGEKESDEATNGSKSAGSVKQGNSPARKSSLNAFMSEDKVCDMLSAEQVQTMFATEETVELRASSFRDNVSCSYSWAPLDKEEREKRFMKSMLAAAKGEGKKLSLRENAMEHQLTISLKQTQQGPERFLPRKSTEAQIQAQIKSAKERAEKRLTEEQKAVAGDVGSMVESMLRKANQNTIIDDIGDAAFWANFGPGSLEVLDGDVHISISPMIAETKEADIENAKQVVANLLN